MILFIVTAIALLGLLVGIPLWSGQGFDTVPVLMVSALAVGVLVSLIWGRSPKD